ncbi:MAG: hypothetical protein KC543_16100 [Myxococcales bacterium]|nr:hypothetical protein [Myxococcales bacterium]
MTNSLMLHMFSTTRRASAQHAARGRRVEFPTEMAAAPGPVTQPIVIDEELRDDRWRAPSTADLLATAAVLLPIAAAVTAALVM